MLKIVDKNNRVKFILEDDADEPRRITDETPDESKETVKKEDPEEEVEEEVMEEVKKE